MDYIKISIFFIVISFIGCSAQTSDDVYQNLEKYYPSAKYLAAIGQGDTRREAEKNAMAKLSLIFESRINVNQTLNEHYTEFSDDESSSLKYESETQKRTNVQSDQKLLNVKFGKSGTDELGNYFVVAYIDRRETGYIYDEKVQDNHSVILALAEKAKTVDSKIKKYALLNRASRLMNENVELMKQLAIIAPHNPDYEDKLATYESIYRQKGEVASQIKFTIVDSSKGDVKNELTSLITSKGFKVGNNGDFIVTSTLYYENVDLGRKEVFYNWFMNIEMKNYNDEIIFNFEKKGREGGISESAVYQRAKFAANKALKKYFIKGFDKYLNSLIGN
jgi:hypothetical protein